MKQAIYTVMTKSCEAISLIAVAFIFVVGIFLAGTVLTASVERLLW